MIKRYLSQELTPIDSNFGGYLRLRLNDILGRVYCPEKNYLYDLVQRKVASFKKEPARTLLVVRQTCKSYKIIENKPIS